jgi:hypothetical protein
MIDVESITVDRDRLNMKLVTFGSAGVGVVVDDDQHVERGVHGRNAFRAVAGAHTDAVDCWANTGPTTPGEAAFISTMRGHIPGDDTTLLMPSRYDRRLRRTCALRLAPAPSGERDGDADQCDDWTKDGPEGVAQPRLPLLRKVYTARPVRHSRVSSDETAGLSEKSSECPARGCVGELGLVMSHPSLAATAVRVSRSTRPP